MTFGEIVFIVLIVVFLYWEHREQRKRVGQAILRAVDLGFQIASEAIEEGHTIAFARKVKDKLIEDKRKEYDL